MNNFILLKKITDKRMTRFNLSLNESAELVINCIRNSIGGEIFVPKIPSYRITDLANAIGPSCKKKIIGIRPGEKIHEEMITSSDSYSTYDVGNFFIILPANNLKFEKKFSKTYKFKKIKEGFSYNSGTNKKFLEIEEIRKLIVENIDNNFKPY